MQDDTRDKPHPCLTCGACCAYFRASFYWAEADDATPGGVPANMTRKLGEFRRSMIGMDGIKPRCIALQGEIGKAVFCSIYERRASVCRAFDPSWEKGRAERALRQGQRSMGTWAVET